MKNKPKKCCFPDCFSCAYTDCRYDGVEYIEEMHQDRFDKELEPVEPEIILRRKSLKKYSQSQKGKERSRRYFRSKKGKDAQKKYRESEKGKQTEKRKSQKKVKSGKNAEYCRAYYYRQKSIKAKLCRLEGVNIE